MAPTWHVRKNAIAGYDVMPLKYVRHSTIVFLLIFFSTQASFAESLKPTICRSAKDEITFKELAGGNAQVLAVCPKKGLYFVEFVANERGTIQFKEKVKNSNLKVTEITTYKEETETGSKVIMVQFEY
jgi:L-2-hydroxyglutarate oxidase LhgO